MVVCRYEHTRLYHHLHSINTIGQDALLNKKNCEVRSVNVNWPTHTFINLVISCVDSLVPINKSKNIQIVMTKIFEYCFISLTGKIINYFNPRYIIYQTPQNLK
jgi:hypothetical protein